MKVTLLVLANSRKHGGRCLAGLDTSSGRWIRPVTDASQGEIENLRTRFDGEFLRPGDLIELSIRKHIPQAHHPENYLIDSEPISLLARNRLIEYSHLVQEASNITNILTLSSIDHIGRKCVDEGKVNASLALIPVTQIQFYISNVFSKTQDRVKFRYRGEDWDLVNTDDKGKWMGEYDEGLMCLSLAEFLPKKNAHYKLAAAFIQLEIAKLNKVSNEEPRQVEETLIAVISKYFDKPMVIHNDDRLKIAGWFLQRKITLRCLKCNSDNLFIFRAHDTKQTDDAVQILHRIAIGCDSCRNIYSTPFDNELFRKQVMQLADEESRVKDICPRCNPPKFVL